MKNIKSVLHHADQRYQAHDQSDARLGALLSQLDEKEAAPTVTATQLPKETLLQRAKSALSRWLPAPALPYAALAMLMVMLMQSGVIVYQHQQLGSGPYETASGPLGNTTPIDPGSADASERYIAIIDKTASLASLSALLTQTKGQMVSGPNSSGAYTIEFEQPLNQPANQLWEESEFVHFFAIAESAK